MGFFWDPKKGLKIATIGVVLVGTRECGSVVESSRSMHEAMAYILRTEKGKNHGREVG